MALSLLQWLQAHLRFWTPYSRLGRASLSWHAGWGAGLSAPADGSPPPCRGRGRGRGPGTWRLLDLD